MQLVSISASISFCYLLFHSRYLKMGENRTSSKQSLAYFCKVWLEDLPAAEELVTKEHSQTFV